MMKITKDGYFKKGAFKLGVNPTMIGQKIIHVDRCETPYGYDGSYCTIAGIGIPQNPKDEYVILRGILDGGSLLIEGNPCIFPGETSILEPWWNDGKWVLLESIV